MKRNNVVVINEQHKMLPAQVLCLENLSEMHFPLLITWLLPLVGKLCHQILNRFKEITW